MANIIRGWEFVLESWLPFEEGEDLQRMAIEKSMRSKKRDATAEIKANDKVKEVRYAWHWFCGISVMPGTGVVKDGKPIPPIWVNVWSPYFPDAMIFHDREEVQEYVKKTLSMDSGYVITDIDHSHYKQSWIAPAKE